MKCTHLEVPGKQGKIVVSKEEESLRQGHVESVLPPAPSAEPYFQTGVNYLCQSDLIALSSSTNSPAKPYFISLSSKTVQGISLKLFTFLLDKNVNKFFYRVN